MTTKIKTNSADKNSVAGVKKHGIIFELKKNWVLYMMTLPAVVFLLIFSYYPLTGLQIAFRDYNVVDGIWKSPFAGIKYFKDFFQSAYASQVTFNTLYLNLLFIVVGHVFAVTIAILLNEVINEKLKKVFQVSMFFPYFLSWVIISAIVYSFLNDKFGVLNTFLAGIGLPTHAWYNMPQLWRGILTVINTWQSFGYNVIIYLAVIVSIDSQIYEAARIDGANKMDEIFKITIPQMMPTIVLLLLLALGKIFYGNFGMLYAIIGDNGVLLKNTDVIDTYVFRAMRTDGAYSLATAVGLYQSVLGFVLVLIFNKLAKMYDDTMGLF